MSENQRVLPRHKGNVLCEDLGHTPVPLIDMTTKGISFLGHGHQVGDVINLWLISEPNPQDTVEAMCRIVNVLGERVSAVFIERTEKLENFIVTHIIDDPPLIQS